MDGRVALRQMYFDYSKRVVQILQCRKYRRQTQYRLLLDSSKYVTILLKTPSITR